jgi:predicted TIM-barrel fold metal-dependent hydrolase
MIFDLQVHLWEANRPDRPWRPDRKPSLPEPFGPEQFLPLMDAAGVDRAIIVPPGIMGTDNRYGLECAAAHPTRFAVMGLIDMLAADVEDQVAAWLDQPGMVGIRTHVHEAERVKWPSPRAADLFWAACERFQVPVAVFFAGSMSPAHDILERFPATKLIVDHMGLPLIDVSSTHPDVPGLLALARYPNVAVKLSTAASRSAKGYPFPEIHELIYSVIDAYGPRRSFFATDHTQQLTRGRATYRQEVDLFRKELRFASEADRSLVLGEAAADYLGWPDGVLSTELASTKAG